MPRNFKCEKCGAAFEKNRDLQNHLARKNPCDPIVEEKDQPEEKKGRAFKCAFCARTFNSLSNMQQHIRKNCKIAPRNGDPSGMQKLVEHVQKKQDEKNKTEIEALRAELKELKDSLRPAGDGTMPLNHHEMAAGGSMNAHNVVQAGGSVTAHNVVQAGQITQNIHVEQKIMIVAFGNETFGHISQSDMGQILAAASEAGKGSINAAAMTAVAKTAELVYSNDAAPQNMTCYRPNKKTAEVMIHSPRGWEMSSVQAVGPKIAQRSIRAIFDCQPQEGKDMERSEKVLAHLRDHGDEIAAKGAVDVGPVLSRNKLKLQGTLKRLPAAGEKTAMPAAAAATHREEKKRPVISRAREDEIFEELYPSASGRPAKPRTRGPRRYLKALTQADAIAVLKARGLDDERKEIEIDRSQAVDTIRACAARAAPWDEASEREAFKMAEELFWTLSRYGKDQLGPNALQRAADISAWGQGV